MRQWLSRAPSGSSRRHRSSSSSSQLWSQRNSRSSSSGAHGCSVHQEAASAPSSPFLLQSRHRLHLPGKQQLLRRLQPRRQPSTTAPPTG